jgi:1-acyl-sn-glycerol-3-phosphate acyltransferase
VERCLFGLRVTGAELVPRSGAVIIASNHVSYSDPPVVGSAVPREVYFLAKEELFANPVFAWLIRRYNAIALKRAVGDIGAVKKAVELLKQGKAILMFPEGTRSLGGRLLRPKPGLGLIACMGGAQVVPAYVTGTNSLGQVLLRRRKLAVSFGEPVDATEFGDRAASSHERYSRLTEEVMKRIENLAREVAPPPGPRQP